ncbi:MAG: serine--tRNA ligase, partial [Acidobacteria bacterium]|nr:serine--tRNA ligase [Acidobacteriota bacterium]
MLDPSLVRDRFRFVQDRLALRGGAFDRELQRVADLDGDRRALIPRVEESRRARKDLSERIAQAKKEGEDAQALVMESQTLGDQIKELESQLEGLEAERRGLLLRLPNLPHESVPEGTGSEGNVEVRKWGTPRDFDFSPKAHWELGPALGILDFDRAAKISGARFSVLLGAGARLAR